MYIWDNYILWLVFGYYTFIHDILISCKSEIKGIYVNTQSSILLNVTLRPLVMLPCYNYFIRIILHENL